MHCLTKTLHFKWVYLSFQKFWEVNFEHIYSSGMMHPHTQIINIVMLCRMTTSISGLVRGMNEVNIKQLDSSNINNSLYK